MAADDLFELQQQGDVTIVRFIENRALDSMAISQMSDSLFQVVDQLAESRSGNVDLRLPVDELAH